MNYQSVYQFMETGEATDPKNTELELDQITKQYPWFESGHILSALYKSKYVKSDAADEIRKAHIYMHDPLWMNWLIMKFDKDLTEAPYKEKLNGSENHNEATASIKIKKALAHDEKNVHQEEEINFEPLHTIDYFASQGIRLQQDHLGNDNLSKQVKTFTQWLKSMKKIYHETPSETPPNEDGQVVQMADASNNNEEVYTETMAEVLINQGKKKQAIAIYKKLSLLYPEKSSYFTTRISDLNQ
ncbi:MAG: hypothetical protein ACK5BV_03040 [Bacteroidota bacterium]